MDLIDKNNTTPDLSLLAQSDKLQLLYQQSFPAIFISLMNAVLLTTILWPAQDHPLLLTWFGFLCATSTARLMLFLRYRKAAPLGPDVLRWEKPFFITLILSSLVWGVGCVLIMPVDSPVHHAIIFCFLIGMSGGAISVYSAQYKMTLATIAAVLLPITVYSLITGDLIFVGMAIAAIIFFLSAIRATKILGSALHQNFLMTHQLRFSKEEAERMARVDDLTGLFNRRAFYEYGEVLANNSQRSKDELAMVLMDIDNFKSINDRFGHAAGDIALKQIGRLLLQRLRKSDIYARIGGEEFGMLLPQTPLGKAAQLAEELRKAIEDMPIQFENETFTVTASFGVTSGVCDIDSLVRQADMTMYQSKDAGRNAVACNK